MTRYSRSKMTKQLSQGNILIISRMKIQTTTSNCIHRYPISNQAFIMTMDFTKKLTSHNIPPKSIKLSIENSSHLRKLHSTYRIRKIINIHHCKSRSNHSKSINPHFMILSAKLPNMTNIRFTSNKVVYNRSTAFQNRMKNSIDIFFKNSQCNEGM